MKPEAIAKSAARTRAWMKTPEGENRMSAWKAEGHQYRRRLALAVIEATRIERYEIIDQVVEVLAKSV